MQMPSRVAMLFAVLSAVTLAGCGGTGAKKGHADEAVVPGDE